MERRINGFVVDWAGTVLVEVRRIEEPRHKYLFETSSDRKDVTRLHSLSPSPAAGREALADAGRVEEQAKNAAREFLKGG
jgi:hypothetical protein